MKSRELFKKLTPIVLGLFFSIFSSLAYAGGGGDPAGPVLTITIDQTHITVTTDQPAQCFYHVDNTGKGGMQATNQSLTHTAEINIDPKDTQHVFPGNNHTLTVTCNGSYGNITTETKAFLLAPPQATSTDTGVTMGPQAGSKGLQGDTNPTVAAQDNPCGPATASSSGSAGTKNCVSNNTSCSLWKGVSNTNDNNLLLVLFFFISAIIFVLRNRLKTLRQ